MDWMIQCANLHLNETMAESAWPSWLLGVEVTAVQYLDEEKENRQKQCLPLIGKLINLIQLHPFGGYKVE